MVIKFLKIKNWIEIVFIYLPSLIAFRRLLLGSYTGADIPPEVFFERFNESPVFGGEVEII